MFLLKRSFVRRQMKPTSLLQDFEAEASMRLDIFNAKVAAEKNIKAFGRWEKLSPEEQRLVEKMVNISVVQQQIQVCLIFQC
jgi:hypothetical protein